MNSVNNVGLTVADPHGFLFSNLSIFEQCFSRILVCKGQIGLVYSRTRVEFLSLPLVVSFPKLAITACCSLMPTLPPLPGPLTGSSEDRSLAFHTHSTYFFSYLVDAKLSDLPEASLSSVSSFLADRP